MGQSLDRPCLKRMQPRNQSSLQTSLQNWQKSVNNHHLVPLSRIAFRGLKRNRNAFMPRNFELDCKEVTSPTNKYYRFHLVTAPISIHKWSDPKAIELTCFFDYPRVEFQKALEKSFKSLVMNFPNLTQLNLEISSDSYFFPETLVHTLQQLRFLQKLFLRIFFSEHPLPAKKLLDLTKKASKMFQLKEIMIEVEGLLDVYYKESFICNEKHRTLSLAFDLNIDYAELESSFVMENFTKSVKNYLRDLNEFDFTVYMERTEGLGNFQSIERILTLASYSKKLESLTFRMFSHGEITKKALNMIILKLATRFKSLKKIHLEVPASSLARNTELGEEDIIGSLGKICENLVDLESLKVCVKRVDIFSDEGLEKICREVTENLKKLTYLSLKINCKTGLFGMHLTKIKKSLQERLPQLKKIDIS